MMSAAEAGGIMKQGFVFTILLVLMAVVTTVLLLLNGFYPVAALVNVLDP